MGKASPEAKRFSKSDYYSRMPSTEQRVHACAKPSHPTKTCGTSIVFAAFLCLFCLLISPRSLADAGVFTGNGQDLHQITSKTVQLASIEVTIVLGRGPFLFDGTVPGMDRAEYLCKFELRNLSEQDQDIEVGFPVDSQFARGREPEAAEESGNWVLEYAFIARDDKATYHVNFVHRKPQAGTGEFSSVFVWSMHFSPRETRNLTVEYRIPMSMGLVPMQKDENLQPLSGAFGAEFLNIGQVEMAGYITSTGSSWAGNVESARFTVLTEAFEQYFNRRGVTEEIEARQSSKDLAQFNSSFPVHHPYWIRQVKPGGWESVKGGLQWSYKDFKPNDPIEIRYYTTPFPRLPDEAVPFVKTFLQTLGPNQPRAAELDRLKQVVAATDGCEPTDPQARTFVSQQLWFSPSRDCSAGRLSSSQKEVLHKIEVYEAAAKSH